MQEVRWGIIGCGGIANTFASSLSALDSGILLAGASQTQGKADAFAEKHGVERSYSEYKSKEKAFTADRLLQVQLLKIRRQCIHYQYRPY